MKNNTSYTLNEQNDSDVKLTLDNIYIGRIMRYNASLMGKYTRISKRYSFVRNAILVKLNCSYSNHNLYVELEKFDLNLLRLEKVSVSSLFCGNIMADQPLYIETCYVDESSLKKYDYKKGIATGISSNKNEKVKKLVKEINQKGA